MPLLQQLLTTLQNNNVQLQIHATDPVFLFLEGGAQKVNTMVQMANQLKFIWYNRLNTEFRTVLSK